MGLFSNMKVSSPAKNGNGAEKNSVGSIIMTHRKYANHANAKNQGCHKVHSKLQVTNGFSPHILLETQLSSEVQKADPST
jgi:hypothetical protein